MPELYDAAGAGVAYHTPTHRGSDHRHVPIRAAPTPASSASTSVPVTCTSVTAEIALPGFELTCYDVQQLGTIRPLLASSHGMCGLYVLRFADGTAYVGQSVDIARRFLEHRRRFDDLVAIEVTPWAREHLDAGEQRLIAAIEAGCTIRNILHTDRPGGDNDIAVAITEAQSIILPWDRNARTRPNAPGAHPPGTDRRVEYLRQIGDLDSLAAIIGIYVHETIPDPTNTVPYLWNVTALPSTARTGGQRRLATLNCGNLETLYITDYPDENYARIWFNIARPTGRTDDELTVHSPGVWTHPFTYKSQQVWTWEVDYITYIEEDLQPPIPFDDFNDLAYQLNVRLMRRGTSRFARHHNPHFAADILDAAHSLTLEAPLPAQIPATTPQRT